MSDLAYKKLTQINDTDVVARELTLAEVRQWAKASAERDTGGVDTVDFLLQVDGFQVAQLLLDLPMMCDVSADVLAGWHPSDISKLLSVCQGLNPDFFAMVERMQAANPSLPEN